MAEGNGSIAGAESFSPLAQLATRRAISSGASCSGPVGNHHSTGEKSEHGPQDGIPGVERGEGEEEKGGETSE